MTRTLKLITVLICAAGGIYAQVPCTNLDAYSTPGAWIRQKRDSFAGADRNFPAAQYPAVLSKAQKAVELLKLANPIFKGIQAYAYRSISGDSYTPGGALPFRVDGVYDAYICVGNNSGAADARGKVLLNGNTFWVSIRFNSLGALATEKSIFYEKLVTTTGDKIYIAPRSLGQFKDLPFLRAGGQVIGKPEAVVITSNNRSPFKILTRGEYLQARVRALQVQIDEMTENLRKSDAQSNTDIKRIDDNATFTAQQKNSIKETIRQTGLQQKQVITKLEADSGAFAAKIAAMSASERGSQAVVRDPFALPGSGKLFMTEAEGGKPLVVIDKGLFDPKLPRAAIQLITVEWNWDDKHPAMNAAIDEFKKNFDFAALGQMLGK